MQLLKKTFGEFIQDDCMSMGAALAFYTMFSLAPILIILITLVSLFLGSSEAAQTQLIQQINSLMGAEAGKQAQAMAEAQLRQGTSGIATILGLVALLFGATGVMAQLQYSLNRIWKVEPDPNRGGLKNFLMKRLLSFAMIVAIAFLLLVSLVLSAVLAAFAQRLAAVLPEGTSPGIFLGMDILLSLVVFTLLFGIMFKVLPDAKMRWRDLWVGAFVTALLFSLGKLLIGLYLGRSHVGSAYGVAGSLAVLLIWVYYSSLIVFLGAEFTRAWASSYGQEIVPAEGAVRVINHKQLVPG